MAELTNPAADPATPSTCGSTEAQATCCEPSQKSSGCGESAAGRTFGCSTGQSTAPVVEDLRETVREKYAAAARAVAEQSASTSCCGPIAFTDAGGREVFGASLYADGETEGATATGDKLEVLAEAARVLKPGGRFAVSDVVAVPDMDDATRADMAANTGCIAGALTQAEFRAALTAAGLTDIEIRETHRGHEQATSAIVRARKPADWAPAPSTLTPESLPTMTSLDTTTSDTTIPARRVELYEPAMCCQTGVCGPSVDQQLIDVREDLRWVEAQGARVARHNLSSEPDAFVANPKVTGLMQAFGEAALPVLVVDGDIAVHGRYPSRGELAGLLAAEVAPVVELPQGTDGGAGCGPSGCC